MRKIISLFQRNYEGDRLVRNEVVPEAEWVLLGEGVPTRKYDGTCCLVKDKKLFKRYEVKPGGTPPDNFQPANEVDENTGKQQGWIPVGEGPEDRWHREAFSNYREDGSPPSDGTYELLGPKVQGNLEGYKHHILLPHGDQGLYGNPRTFDDIKEYLSTHDIEGIVWHHADGRMVKIKQKDFGMKRTKEKSDV